MKFSWTYLFQLISASLLVGRAAAAPTPEPQPNRAIEARRGDEYLWYIDEAESIHLSELLGVDFHRLGITGVLIDGPKMKCENCGKYTGLDDIVHSALEDGIHRKEYLVKVLEERESHASPPHVVRCSTAGCSRAYEEPRGWGSRWISKTETEENAHVEDA
ncbi:hypothetical protein BKA93DRAFT_826928 [Sparassis latifolia]|uniref:Unnamed protein n=1 Tax=Sparassis crispa TaxID=139825 RepID=A0A401G9L2_9APHY|nr:unnamed protein [Sparassis crispa]GBE78847.1 unnamed protein [Sparassis crispa]